MASPWTEQHGHVKSRWCKGSEFSRACQEVAGIFCCGGVAAHIPRGGYIESGTEDGSSTLSFSSGLKSSVKGMASESSSNSSKVESNSSIGAIDEHPEYKSALIGSLAGWNRW